MLGDAEQFVTFGTESKKFRSQNNTVFKEDEIQISTPMGNKCSYSKLSELTGDYSFFTLGYLYEGVKVPYSFVEQYTAEFGDAYFLTIKSKNELLKDLDPDSDWSYILHAIQKDKFEEFTQYMVSQYLSRKEEGQFVGVYSSDLIIPDPVYKYNTDYKLGLEDIKVRCFLPQTRKGRVVVTSDEKGNIIHFIEKTPTSISKELYSMQVINNKGVV